MLSEKCFVCVHVAFRGCICVLPFCYVIVLTQTLVFSLFHTTDSCSLDVSHSQDILNNLDNTGSCDLEDDDLMLDVDLPEDGALLNG